MVKNTKKIVINGAWPYVHGVPHLGNFIGCILPSDVLKRYYKLAGYDVILVSGSDSHGTRMEYEALKQRITPKELVLRNHKKLKKILKDFGCDYDLYTITENPTHKKFAREVYTKLFENGYITTRIETHPYCVNCRKFLAERFVIGTCPYCGYEKAKGDQCDKCTKVYEATSLVNPKCAICKKGDIIQKESKHWYLDLPKLVLELKNFFNKKKKEWRQNVAEFTEGWLKEGLRPRPVTRDLEWGVKAPFPGAEDKVLYVWAEAVLGYISATIEFFKKKKKPNDWKKYWLKDDVKHVYVHGKDNIIFHTIILPAILIGTKENYHLPDQLSVTEYLNWEGGEKFSKTECVGVFMDAALELLSPDYWRFYLLYILPENKDTEFSWHDFEQVINNVAIADLANFVNRTLTFINKYFKGVIPKPKKQTKDLIKDIREAEVQSARILEKGFVRDALKTIIMLVKKGNEYFQKKEPWKNEAERETTIYYCTNLLKALAILTNPFIPFTSEKIWKMLGLKGKAYDQRNWNSEKNSIYKDEIKPGNRIGKTELLFNKINKEELKKKLEEICRIQL